MTRVLALDCANLILSYLPLEQFSKYTASTDSWKARFQLRYGQKLKSNCKKLYLLRAATEYYEVCIDTIGLYTNHHYCSLIYYYAARAGYWGFLSRMILTKHPLVEFGKEMLFLAVSANQTDIAAYICEQIMEGCTFIDNIDELPENIDLIKRLYSIVKNNPGYRHRNSLLDYVIKHITHDEYRKLIENISTNSYWINYLPTYNSRDHQQKLDLFNQLDDQTKQLFYNETTELQYDYPWEIYWLAPNAIDHRVINTTFQVEDLYCIYRNFPLIPNALERAQQTIDKLLVYVDQNKELYNYIAYIKLILGTLTVDDINEHVEINMKYIFILIKQNKLDLALQIIDRSTTGINFYHIFTDKSQLQLINSKMIFEDVSWIQIFTFSCLASITEQDIEIMALDDSNQLHVKKLKDVVISDIQRYFPDVLDLIKCL